MTEKLKQQFVTALVLGAIVLAVAIVGWLLWRFSVWFFAQSVEIVVASITFSGTIIAAIIAVIASQQTIKAREIAESHRPKKIKVYEMFLTGTMDFMRDFSGKTPAAKKKAMTGLENFTHEFNKNIMMWGSPEVLKAYGAFKSGAKSEQVLLMVDDILRAMRKDLGLKDKGLERGDLIKLLLSDPEYLG